MRSIWSLRLDDEQLEELQRVQTHHPTGSDRYGGGKGSAGSQGRAHQALRGQIGFLQRRRRRLRRHEWLMGPPAAGAGLGFHCLSFSLLSARTPHPQPPRG